MTTWTVKLEYYDRLVKATTDISFLHAVLLSRRLWKEEYAKAIRDQVNFTPPTVWVISSDDPLWVHITTGPRPKYKMHLTVHVPRSSGVSLRLSKSAKGPMALDTSDLEMMVENSRTNKRKLRTARNVIRSNFNADLDASTCVYHVPLGRMGMGDLINAAAGPYTVQGRDIFFSTKADTRFQMINAIRTAGLSRRLYNHRPVDQECINGILAMLTKPDLLKTLTKPPEAMTFNFTDSVQDWIVENNIQWAFGETGHEFVNEEDYVLYKVMFT